jgi:hypothetical protein
MKKAVNNLFLLITLFVFCSCVIREPETKPDDTRVGLQMFNYSETSIFYMVRCFDKMLFLNSYINKTDSAKNIFRKQYFQQYKFTQPTVNKWFIKRETDGDTIYTIYTDGNSIHKIGSIWKLKEKNDSILYTITCKSANKWEIEALNKRVESWNVNAKITINCIDSFAPVMYQTSNFVIKGGGILTSNNENKEQQQLQINYSIKDSLIHRKPIWICTSGSLDLEVKEFDTGHTEKAVGKYYNIERNVNSLEITYHNKVNTYTNRINTSYLW